MRQSTMISETISHYRILQKLGAGGMGEVYLAEDTRLSRKAASSYHQSKRWTGACRMKRREQYLNGRRMAAQ